jgi:SNF2 family DNA or RNA helicase
MLMDVAAGGGKTITNYALGHCLKADTRIYVVPKNSVHDVWLKTIRTLFRTPQDHWHSLSGTEPVAGTRHYIVHFDYLDKFLEFAKKNKGKFGQVFVAIDESHNFNEDSARTRYLIDLCSTVNARDVIHASGTPFKAMGSEAITLLKTVCPDFTPEVEASFRKLFGKEAKKALEILANRIGIVSFKVLKAEVETPGVDYFEKRIKIKNSADYTLNAVRERMTAFIAERLAMYKKQMREHEELYALCMDFHQKSIGSSNASLTLFAEYRRNIAIIRKGYDPITMKDLVMFCNRYELKTILPSLPEKYRKPFLNVRAIIKYVELKVMGEALSQVLGRMRIQCHLDMLPEMPLDEIIDNSKSKTVIFTSYVEVVKELEIRLREAGYKPLVVYGETNKDLPDIVKKFDTDPDANPLIATFKSLSTAVPLVSASTEVFTNSPFREYERTQAVARVDRVGQQHRCSIYDTFLDTDLEPNISTRSKDILAWSKQQVEAILGVQSPDDLEASLESLADVDGVVSMEAVDTYIGMLKTVFPIDVIDND